jgi:hypothetical protein
MQVVKGEGNEPVCLLQNCKDCCVYENLAPCSAIDKGAMIFIDAIPIGFQIANKKRRLYKTLKGSQRRMGGGGQAKFLKISASLPLIRILNLPRNLQICDSGINKRICGLKKSKKFVCPLREKGSPGEPPFFPTAFPGKTETLVGRGGSDVMADDDSGSVRVAPSALSRLKTTKKRAI